MRETVLFTNYNRGFNRGFQPVALEAAKRGAESVLLYKYPQVIRQSQCTLLDPIDMKKYIYQRRFFVYKKIVSVG